MSDDGSQKDDVKVPDGDVGDKITKLFTDEGKDTSELLNNPSLAGHTQLTMMQTSLFLLLWVRRLPSMPRKLRRVRTAVASGGRNV